MEGMLKQCQQVPVIISMPGLGVLGQHPFPHLYRDGERGHRPLWVGHCGRVAEDGRTIRKRQSSSPWLAWDALRRSLAWPVKGDNDHWVPFYNADGTQMQHNVHARSASHHLHGCVLSPALAFSISRAKGDNDQRCPDHSIRTATRRQSVSTSHHLHGCALPSCAGNM